MKTTLIMTFAFALMVFAFNTGPVMAKSDPKCPKGYHWGKMTGGKYACLNTKVYGQVDELKDSDQADDERDVADSGDEGSTSAAGATDQ